MSQCKVLEEGRRRSIQQRPADALTTSDDVNQTALGKGLENRSRSYAPYFFDFSTADRLTVGNDRERLQRCRGQPLRTRGELRALDCLRVLRTRKNLPAACNLDQLNTVTIGFVMIAELQKGLVQRRLAVFGVSSDGTQRFRGDWCSAREERGLKQLR